MLASRRLVLLVEDDPLIAELVSTFLDELGYSVVGPAYRRDEALGLAARATFDAALLDWSLDTGSSACVADALVARNIPFVFMTGFNEIPDRAHREVPILQKPFRVDDLRRTLEQMLGLKAG